MRCTPTQLCFEKQFNLNIRMSRGDTGLAQRSDAGSVGFLWGYCQHQATSLNNIVSEIVLDLPYCPGIMVSTNFWKTTK
ncbi:hypothetical protein D3C76_1336350 [compost metagenome]